MLRYWHHLERCCPLSPLATFVTLPINVSNTVPILLHVNSHPCLPFLICQAHDCCCNFKNAYPTTMLEDLYLGHYKSLALAVQAHFLLYKCLFQPIANCVCFGTPNTSVTHLLLHANNMQLSTSGTTKFSLDFSEPVTIDRKCTQLCILFQITAPLPLRAVNRPSAIKAFGHIVSLNTLYTLKWCHFTVENGEASVYCSDIRLNKTRKL